MNALQLYQDRYDEAVTLLLHCDPQDREQFAIEAQEAIDGMTSALHLEAALMAVREEMMQ